MGFYRLNVSKFLDVDVRCNEKSRVSSVFTSQLHLKHLSYISLTSRATSKSFWGVVWGVVGVFGVSLGSSFTGSWQSAVTPHRYTPSNVVDLLSIGRDHWCFQHRMTANRPNCIHQLKRLTAMKSQSVERWAIPALHVPVSLFQIGDRVKVDLGIRGSYCGYITGMHFDPEPPANWWFFIQFDDSKMEELHRGMLYPQSDLMRE